jgi:phosphohistidine phosphatase
MPVLMLLRHGKSSWADEGQSDFDRPLSQRGERDMAAMADVVGSYPVDRILCSPSQRTRETLELILPGLRSEPEIVLEERLYEPERGYREIMAEAGKAADCLLVIGHNPAIQATALSLAGSGSRKLLKQMAAKFPTGALAVIEFEDRWMNLAPASGRLTAFERPREVTGAEEAN